MGQTPVWCLLTPHSRAMPYFHMPRVGEAAVSEM